LYSVQAPALSKLILLRAQPVASSPNFLGIQRIIWISYRLRKSFNFSPSWFQPFSFQFPDLCLVVESSARFQSLSARLCRQIHYILRISRPHPRLTSHNR
jgi:hypothetical protein